MIYIQISSQHILTGHKRYVNVLVVFSIYCMFCISYYVLHVGLKYFDNATQRTTSGQNS